jgi:two-component system LytT family response regulator
MNFSVIIVDDEPPARKRIADLLRGELDFQITAQCADGQEAQQALRRYRPDLLFLDVEMPEPNGFDLLEGLAGLSSAVIFVTAHAEHAVRAFGVDAVDYLLKPFTRDRFRQALAKARAFLRSRSPGVAKPNDQPAGLRRLLVKDGGRWILLQPSRIDWIEAQGNYVALHVGKGSHLLRSTLAGLEAQLAPGVFMRVSRSALVNVERVREIQSLPGGQHIVLLHDGQRIPLTRPLGEVQHCLGG